MTFNKASQKALTRWILMILLLITFLWRLQGLVEESLWRDEVDAILFALGDLKKTLSMFVRPAQNGALYFLGLRPWLQLMGSSEFALRYPAVLFSLLSLPLFWQVGRRLMADSWATSELSKNDAKAKPHPVRRLSRATIGNAAMLAVLFLALNPYQLWYSQDGKMYALITLLAILAIWFWLKGISVGGWRPWLGFLLTVTVAIYTHLLMILLIPLFMLWFVIVWPQSRRHLKGFALALAGLTLPYLPFVWWQWNLLTATDQRTVLSFIPLTDIIEILLLEHNVGITRPDNRIWLAPILVLGITGFFIGYQAIATGTRNSLSKLSARRLHLLIVSWLIMPVLGIYLLSLRQPIFLPRYVIWIAPAGMMLVALGVQLIWNFRARWARPLAFALVIYVMLFWVIIGWQEKSLRFKNDLRGAVSYVSQNRRVNDLLILQIPHLEYAYRYYSGDRGSQPFNGSDVRLGWWEGGLMTNNELNIEEAEQLVDEEMKAITENAADIWLMLSEAELWDERALMLKWLDRNSSQIEVIDFQGAQVRLYQTD